jgi:carbonic anhydrase/acetyltransferase-like protein (isoleucine patch superfamily)
VSATRGGGAGPWIYALGDLVPRIDPSAYIAPTATLIGDVEVGPGASIWFGAVLRGDSGTITVGAGTNVQDLCILHEQTTLGRDCVLGHGVLAHGIHAEDGVVIGNGALVHEGTRIGAGAVVAAGSLVPANTVIPAGTLWMGTPAKQRSSELPERIERRFAETREFYAEAARRYPRELRPL